MSPKQKSRRDKLLALIAAAKPHEALRLLLHCQDVAGKAGSKAASRATRRATARDNATPRAALLIGLRATIRELQACLLVVEEAAT